MWVDQWVLEEAKIVYLSFQAPPPVSTGDPDWCAMYANVGFAGYSPYNADYTVNPVYDRYRQNYLPDDLCLWQTPNNVGNMWWINDAISRMASRRVTPADRSTLNTPTTRERCSECWATSCRIGQDDPAVGGGWTDITQPQVKDWLNALTGDTTHSSDWFTRHGKNPATAWQCEVDYTGPCQPTLDRDCDHWYDSHDDCPEYPTAISAMTTPAVALCYSSGPADLPDHDGLAGSHVRATGRQLSGHREPGSG